MAWVSKHLASSSISVEQVGVMIYTKTDSGGEGAGVGGGRRWAVFLHTSSHFSSVWVLTGAGNSSTAIFPPSCLVSLHTEAAMNYRTVVMYMEIGCFVVCVSGWILVCSTMPTEIWTWSEVESIVLTSSNYFSNLWKDCVSDSTGVSDCKGIPSMFGLNCKWRIQVGEGVFF